jgi:hypothetical protein
MDKRLRREPESIEGGTTMIDEKLVITKHQADPATSMYLAQDEMKRILADSGYLNDRVRQHFLSLTDVTALSRGSFCEAGELMNQGARAMRDAFRADAQDEMKRALADSGCLSDRARQHFLSLVDVTASFRILADMILTDPRAAFFRASHVQRVQFRSERSHDDVAGASVPCMGKIENIGHS